MTDTNTNDNQNNSSEKLYAGKFKTIEDLEAGYKASLPTFQENENLKKKLEEVTYVPADYINPAEIDLDESRVNDIKSRAKEVGMTQKQYENFVINDKKRVELNKQNFEKAKKDVGEQTINILSDYVSKAYPKELHDNLLKTFIGNKEAREAALKHRDQLLNNKFPGIDRTAAVGYAVTQEDINKAHAQKEKNPHDMKARQHYINLLNAKASQASG
jgi:hypothetical protein